MKKIFSINNFQLGIPLAPYIIAEIGVNHEGCLETAKKMIETAAAGGAHAAKFQTYSADKLAIRNSPAYWDTSKETTRSQHELFSKYDSFGPDSYRALARHCTDCSIDFLSTPFDLEAADFLAPMMPIFKIASADITNVPLIRKCASFGKPLIMSTGAATTDEIAFAVSEAAEAGASAVALLHCVLNYPTPDQHAQLGYIKTLERDFPDHLIGYSDHVVPDSAMTCLQMVTMMGCSIIEKHFTLDKSLPGNDHYHAMDELNLVEFNQRLDHFRELYGDETKDLAHEQLAILHARRSIVSSTVIKAGDRLTEQNITAKRPGHGISPVHWDDLLNAVAVVDIEADELIDWKHLQLVDRHR